jgi:hypothetical protein
MSAHNIVHYVAGLKLGKTMLEERRRQKFRPFLFITAILFILLSFTPVYALGPSYEEDMSRQRAQEQQIIEQGYVEEGQNEDEQEPESTSAPYDPMQARLSMAVGMAQLAATSATKADKLTKDPRFQQYQNGGWDFFQGKNDAMPGEYCLAFFWKKNGFVRLSGPGGDYRGAMMTFWGQDIPRPSRQEHIKVTLKQTKEAPQTVEAINFITPGDSYGAIAFVVPSIEALLAGMEDTQSFELEIEGKSVAKVDWHSGLMAKNKLQACINAKGNK